MPILIRGFSLRGTFGTQQVPEKPIPQLPRRSLDTNALAGRLLSHIIAVGEKLQSMGPSQFSDEFLIRLRFLPPQSVIEMDKRKNDPQLPG